MDYKALITDHWQQADADKLSERRNRWICAAGAWKVVGKRNGGTMALALELGMPEPDTVENLAKAWRMYRYIRRADTETDRRRARQLIREYGYTRFFELYNLWTVYEFSPDVAIGYLEHSGGNRAMAAFVEDVEHPLPEWHRRAQTVYKNVFKLTTDLDVPPAVRQWALDGEKLLKEYQT